MSNVEELPRGNRRLTEYEAIVAATPSALDAIPGAVYVCDKDGWLVSYNTEAAQLWGREPEKCSRTLLRVASAVFAG